MEINYSTDTSFSYDFLGTQAFLVITAIGHVLGLVLVAVSIAMFFKVKRLQTRANMFEMNMLLSDVCFLLVSLCIVQPSDVGCLLYSVLYLFFASISTLTSTVIAIERYLMMVQPTNTWTVLPSRRLEYQKVASIWVFGVLLILPPLIHLAQGGTNICLFQRCFFYENIWYPTIFTASIVLMPILVTGFCYVAIYRRVKMAKRQRWLNQLKAYAHQRRMPITNLPSSTSGRSQEVHIAGRKLGKEKQILIKGLMAVLLFVFFWLPFAIYWLIMAATGTQQADNTIIQIYLISLTKFSVAGNIVCYIICSTKFNVHFKKIACAPFVGYNPTITPPAPSPRGSMIERSVISSAAFSQTDSLAMSLVNTKDPLPQIMLSTSAGNHKPPMLRAMSFPAKPAGKARHKRNAVEPLPRGTMSEISVTLRSNKEVIYKKSKSMETA